MEGEGALDGTSGCPAGVCVAASIMLALCASIFVDFLRLYGTPGGVPGNLRVLIPRGTRPGYAHHKLPKAPPVPVASDGR